MTNSMKYHFNRVTGKSGLCRAVKTCPFGKDGEHFNTKNELNAFIEAYESKTHELFSPATKNKLVIDEKTIKKMLNTLTYTINNEKLEHIGFKKNIGNYVNASRMSTGNILIHDSTRRVLFLKKGKDFTSDNVTALIPSIINNFKSTLSDGAKVFTIDDSREDSAFHSDSSTILHDFKEPVFQNYLRIKTIAVQVEEVRFMKKLESRYPDRKIIATDGSTRKNKRGPYIDSYGFVDSKGNYKVFMPETTDGSGSSFNAELNALYYAIEDNGGERIAAILDSDAVHLMVNEEDNQNQKVSKDYINNSEKIDHIRSLVRDGTVVTELVKSHSYHPLNNSVDALLRGTFSFKPSTINSDNAREAIAKTVQENTKWLSGDDFYKPYEKF